MKNIIALSAITLASFTSHADVRINGFANFVGGMTTGSDETVYGYDDSIAFLDESLFAIQISGDINSKVTATGQIVSRGEDDYNTKFEWAYMTYQATDKLAISAGRIRMPLFRYSASSDVAYSYHWVSAPQSVYDVNFSNIDGVKFDYSNYMGDWEYNIQTGLGAYEAELSGGEIRGKNLFFMSAEATYESFKIRTAYGQNKATFELDSINGVIAILESYGLNELANDMYLENDTGTFLGFGAEIDTFTYFISSEITIVTVEESFAAESTSFYLTAGMRLGKFTPSITYETFKDDDEYKFLDQLTGLTGETEAVARNLVTALQTFEDTELVTLGLRYDIDPGVALKVDFSTYTDNLNDDADANLIRFAVNYVF